MSKRRKKKGLLDKQKPKRRSPFFTRFPKTLLSLLFIGLLAVSTYFWLRKIGPVSWAWSRSDERPQLLAAPELGTEDQGRIRDAYRKLERVGPRELNQLAQDLHQNLGLRSIDLIQTSPFQIWIATKPFVASLIVELDRLRYVTDDGIIFGRVPENEVQTLPILRGLDRKASLTTMSNGALIPSAGNQRIIEETLLAIREGKRYNISYRSINYDDFRGLVGDLQEPAYRVTLGFRPFDNKYLKLEKILISLKQRGLTSATIELDYKGKAFVKESVL